MFHDGLFSEQQHVYIHRAGGLLAGFASLAAERGLDPLAEAEQLDRGNATLQLDYAIQIIRLLLLDLDRHRLVDFRRTCDPHARASTEGGEYAPQVGQTVAQVTTQAQEGPAHRRGAWSTASATASASRLARTSCTRKNVAPRS